MEMQQEKCLFCAQIAKFYPKGALETEYVCDCPNCGLYRTTFVFKQSGISKLSPLEKSKVSGYLRELNELEHSGIMITDDNVNDILNSSIVANTLADKLNKLILYLYRKTAYLGQFVVLDRAHNYAICYALNESELDAIVNVLMKLELIEPTFTLQLTYKGIQFAENLKKHMPSTTSVFVAMWFSPELQPIFDSAIKPAIESEECGKFKAFRVDNLEHNNDITDEIIAGI